MVIRSGVTLASNFSSKQCKGECRLVLEEATKSRKGILEVAEPLDRG
jgi:hypothetical protein